MGHLVSSRCSLVQQLRLEPAVRYGFDQLADCDLLSDIDYLQCTATRLTMRVGTSSA